MSDSDELGDDPFSEVEAALVQLNDACVTLNDIFEHLPADHFKALIEKRIGLAGLWGILTALGVSLCPKFLDSGEIVLLEQPVAPGIARLCLSTLAKARKSHWSKSKLTDDRSRDADELDALIEKAYGEIERIRTKPDDTASALLLGSMALRVLPKDLRGVRSMPKGRKRTHRTEKRARFLEDQAQGLKARIGALKGAIGEEPKEWGRLIAELAMDGSLSAGKRMLTPGGVLYNRYASQAIRSRRSRDRANFKRRYGIDPKEFLKLSDAEMMAVSVRTGKGKGELLTGAQATRVKVRAEKLENLKATQAELRAALSKAVEERIGNSARK